MKDYIIATSSTCDLTRDYLDEHQIPFIAYSYVMDEKVYEDDCKESTRLDTYHLMRDGKLLQTSQITAYSYHEFFKGLMDTGKDVLFMDMSVEMSHSYVGAKEASEQIKKEYPNQKFYMMDTRCISGGLGLLIKKLIALKEEGKSYDEAIAYGEANKLKVMHRFIVDNLKWLKLGGRLSNASAMVGTLLNIKPVMYVPDDGKLVAASKIRGRKQAILGLLEGMKRDMENPDGQEIDILNADCLEDAEFLRDKIKETFPTVGKIEITGLGVVIGAHCGPGLLTVFYMGSSRQA